MRCRTSRSCKQSRHSSISAHQHTIHQHLHINHRRHSRTSATAPTQQRHSLTVDGGIKHAHGDLLTRFDSSCLCTLQDCGGVVFYVRCGHRSLYHTQRQQLHRLQYFHRHGRQHYPACDSISPPHPLCARARRYCPGGHHRRLWLWSRHGTARLGEVAVPLGARYHHLRRGWSHHGTCYRPSGAFAFCTKQRSRV